MAGILWAILAILLASGMALFVKLSTAATVPTLVFARFILGVPIFLWVVHRKKITLKWSEVPKNFARSFAGIAALYAFYFALQGLPLVNAVTLAYTSPLFIPILAFLWLKIVVSKRKYIAIGIGFLGVIVILRPTASDFFVVASFLGLASGLFRAIALLSVRLLAKTEPTEKILSYYFFIGASLAVIPLVFDWRPITETLQWLYVFLAGLFALGYQYAFTKACATTPATTVSTVSYLAVVFGGLLGWWVFGEVPDLWVLAGIILIIFGAIFALTDSTPPRYLKKSH